MDSHRIDGIKLNFDRLTTGELQGIHANLLEKHARIVGEIALVETYLPPEVLAEPEVSGGTLPE